MKKYREYYKRTTNPKTFYEYVKKMLAKHDEAPYFEDYEEWEQENFKFSMNDKFCTIIFEWDNGYGYYFITL